MKRDYDREDCAEWPDFGGTRCIVCGSVPTEEHHIPPKGTGGHRHWVGARLRLCHRCHMLWHRHELDLKVIGGEWHWMGKSGGGVSAKRWTLCRDDDWWDMTDWMERVM